MTNADDIISINKNIWNILKTDEFSIETLCRNLGISVNLAKLLNIRNVSYSEASNFLNPKLSTLMPNPSILKDMDKASLRIANAIINQEKIGIIGDYDVDGATSTSVMNLFLNYVGIKTLIHVPEREEGYGPSDIAFKEFEDFGANLVLTLDCGTSAFDILDTHAQNIDIIVLDHHEAEMKLPKIYGIIIM